MSLEGIDVSYAQGDIDWAQVVRAKDFAIIRAGYGANNIDAMARNNVGQCNGLHFPIGLYWFSYAYTVEMARNEGRYASLFAVDYDIDYPIYWDFEYDSVTYAKQHGVNVTAQLFHDMADAFCTEIETADFESGLYYNPDFDRTYNIDYFFTQHPNRSKWIAKWSANPPTSYNVWQYGLGSAGSVPGIGTAIDLDVIGDSPTPPTPPTPSVGSSMPIWFYLRPY